jgi:hypothetical protein
LFNLKQKITLFIDITTTRRSITTLSRNYRIKTRI